MYFDLERRTENTTKQDTGAPKSSSKQKPRGVGAPNPPPSSSTTPPDGPATDPQPTFEVDAGALKDFRTVFYTLLSGSNPGEVPGADFVHAMVSTGFKREQLYGSIWQISPMRLDVERSIQFHERHPSPETTVLGGKTTWATSLQGVWRVCWYVQVGGEGWEEGGTDIMT